jgi:hypothetical protein
MEVKARIAATPLRVTRRAADSNRHVLRVSIDQDLDALAVRDATAGSVRDGGTATTWIRQDDAGQVAESMRHRNGNLADRNLRARPSAGWAELHRHRRQIPADGLTLAHPDHDVPALLQTSAGTGVTPRFPAQLALDLVAANRDSVRWKQSEKRHLVLVRFVTGLSHISSLCFLHASRRSPRDTAGRRDAIPLRGPEPPKNCGTATSQAARDIGCAVSPVSPDSVEVPRDIATLVGQAEKSGPEEEPDDG